MNSNFSNNDDSFCTNIDKSKKLFQRCGLKKESDETDAASP